MSPQRFRRTVAALALAGGLCLAAPGVAPAAPAPASTASSLTAPHGNLRSYVEAWAQRNHVDVSSVSGAQNCDQNTVYDQWYRAQIDKLSPADQDFLNWSAADLVPFVDAYLTTNVDDPTYALGVHAHDLTKTFRKLQGFWDIDGSRIKLMAFHGSVLTDQARVRAAYVELGVPESEADQWAQYVVSYVASSPALRGGNNPLLTQNAFAMSKFGQDPAYRDRIVVGDGVLQAYDELGYGDVAPETILAHEYGHQVQFQIGMITADTVASPATTRRTELHADASSAYFTSHPKGMSMQWKRVQQFLAVDYSIGDCGFTNPGHHGTPAQRRAAGAFGYQTQEADHPKSYVLPATVFRDRYDAALPGILAAG